MTVYRDRKILIRSRYYAGARPNAVFKISYVGAGAYELENVQNFKLLKTKGLDGPGERPVS